MSNQGFVFNQIVRTNKFLQIFSPNLSARFSINLFCTPKIKRIKSQRVKDVFDSSVSSEIYFDKRRIQIYEFGVENTKKILLVHGWEGHGADFYRMIPTLVESGYHVVTFDGPAHGLSSGKTTNMIEFAQVINLISHKFENEFDSVIAHSFGGGASLVALTSYPNIKVKNIVTISSPDKISKIFDDFFNLLQINEKTQLKFLRILEKRTQSNVEELSLSHLYSKLKVNKLIVHDSSDRVVSCDDARSIIGLNPDIKFMETQGLGHVKILHSKDVHSRILQFIKD